MHEQPHLSEARSPDAGFFLLYRFSTNRNARENNTGCIYTATDKGKTQVIASLRLRNKFSSPSTLLHHSFGKSKANSKSIGSMNFPAHVDVAPSAPADAGKNAGEELNAVDITLAAIAVAALRVNASFMGAECGIESF